MNWWAIKLRSGKIIAFYCTRKKSLTWDKYCEAKAWGNETDDQTEERLKKRGVTVVKIEVKESGNN